MVYCVLAVAWNRASRDLIYAGLLRSMSPEHKFNSAAKLCGEVLAGVADGLLPLSECEEVLRDALCLMACKEIKVRLPLSSSTQHTRRIKLPLLWATHSVCVTVHVDNPTCSCPPLLVS